MTKNKLALRYGLMLCGFAIVYSLIINIMGMAVNKNAGYLSYLIMPFVLFFGFKQANSIWDNLSFGNLFGIGFKICALGAVGISIFSYVYFSFIDPDLIGEMVQMMEDQLYNSGNLSEDQIEAALSLQKTFMTPGSIAIMGFLGYLFFGAIWSLIMAGALKPKEQQEY